MTEYERGHADGYKEALNAIEETFEIRCLVERNAPKKTVMLRGFVQTAERMCVGQLSNQFFVKRLTFVTIVVSGLIGVR